MGKSRVVKRNKPETARAPGNSLTAFLIAVGVFGLYLRTVQNGFVNFDDDIYVYANPHIRDGLTLDGLRWAFTSVSYVYYQPITWISHMLDISWFGLSPAGHHFISAALHAGTAAMLFLWLANTTQKPWRAGVATVLFAIHPLRVESVAWAAERKDVLSAFLFLAALLAYTRYVKAPSAGRYAATAASLTLGLLAKPMLVAAPVLFLLADYWPLRRNLPVPALIREKIPFVLLSAVTAALAYIGQKAAGAMGMLEHLSVSLRIENALVSYGSYLGKTIWPYPLTVLYPYDSSIPLWRFASSAVVLCGITALVFYFRKDQAYLPAGWLWFLIALLPAIGLVQVGMQASADRFTYIPSIGLMVAVVWGIAEYAERSNWPRKNVAILASVVCASLAMITWIQMGYWSDTITLFAHTVRHTGENPLAEQNLGVALGEGNRNAEAAAHLTVAVRASPNMFQAQYNLGKAQANLGQPDAAAKSFSAALKLKPDYADAYYSRAVMFQGANREQEAKEDLKHALRYGLALQYRADAYNNLGVIEAKAGNAVSAAVDFGHAVEMRPNFPEAQINLSMALVESGRKGDAIVSLRAAEAATNGNAAVRNALATLQPAH